MAADTPSQMRLALHLLGPYRATIGGEPVPESRAKKIEALLIYLALDGDQALRRENLVGLLFPDMPDEAARTNLRQSLTRLRRAIRDQEADPSFLTITRESVQFNLASDHFVDATAFEELQDGCVNHRGQRDGRCSECMARAQKALDLYRQPFLDGFFLEDSAAFDEWVLSQRERYQQAALAMASQLADFYERRGDYAAAEGIARRQIQIEPWREEAHRQLMRALAYQGRRGDALRQYERLTQLLVSELGLEPARTTELLRRRIASASDERRNNLPPRDLSFVGRSEELANVHEHLVDPERRLVSLVGPGGSGKTALAIEAGWQATSMYLGPFIHGIFLIPLAGIERPKVEHDAGGAAYVPLVSAVADALAFSPTTDVTGELIDYLNDKQLLLILDNAEHLIGSVRDLVLALLHGAPTVKILTTSRRRLNLANEWLVEIGGLPVIDVANQDPRSSSTDDATRLFLQRAQRVVPQIAPSSSSTPCPRTAVVRICQLVQGLPLGVELAASWVRLLTCQEIAAELEKNLDFLRSTTAGIEARHQSLRAVFEYSWDLLGEPERQIFSRLAVFSGAFDRHAAQSVADATPQGLATLVDYSLLQRRVATTGTVQRYEILESLRHFAAEKHKASVEGSAQLAERHSAYFLDYLATRLGELRSEGQQVAVKEIAQEIGNIRAAWRSTVEREDLTGLASAQEALALFYYMRSWFAEGESMFALATSQLAMEQRDPEQEKLRAQLMAWHGWFRTLRGQVAEGHEVLQGAATELRRLQATSTLASMLPYLAVATSAAGDNTTAEAAAREALKIGRQREDSYIQSVSSNALSQILYLQGDYRQAGDFGRESLALQRESGNYWSMAFSLVNLGRAAHAAADYRQARTYYREAIEIRETMGDARGKALGLLYLGDAALAERHLEPARQAYQESLAIFQDVGSRAGSAEALVGLGHIARQEQEPQLAQRHYVEALSLARTGQAVQPMLEAMLGLALLLAEQVPEQALAAAQVVVYHPAAGEDSRHQAEALTAQLAGELGVSWAEDSQPQATGPTQAVEMLDDTAGQLLRVARPD